MRIAGRHYRKRAALRCQRHAERVEHAAFRTREAAGHQHQLRIDLALGAFHGLGLASGPIERAHLQTAHMPSVVQQHLLRIGAPFAQVIALQRDSFLLTVICLAD